MRAYFFLVVASAEAPLAATVTRALGPGRSATKAREGIIA